jgi:AcrR family transcriptional regulator
VEALLDATAQVLVKSGYEGTNTNRIAEAAGVSVGSLYQYFPSKEALVAELVERHSEQMWALILENTTSVMREPLPIAARHVIRALFAAHAVEPRLHKVLHEQMPRVGKLRKFNEITARSTELAQLYLTQHSADILPRDTRLAAFTIVTSIESLAHAGLEHLEYLHSGALEQETVDVVLRYLTGKSASG